MNNPNVGDEKVTNDETMLGARVAKPKPPNQDGAAAGADKRKRAFQSGARVFYT